MSHKAIIQDFFDCIVANQTALAFDRYVAMDFIHHNQHCEGSRQGLLDGMLQADAEMPNTSITIHQIIEEGDKVMTYSNVAKETMNIAVMHLFRFDDHDKIVEMWDSGTALDSKSPNQNGAF